MSTPYIKLKNVIQPYAWGTTDFIPQLLKYSNDNATPQAELWMGTHANGMSQDEKTGQNLIKILQQNPQFYCNRDSIDTTGLPFLFKVLSAASPLSVQVHPTIAQAQAGYSRENEANIPVNAPTRNYKDANHKPEIICALTPYYGMKGFRPISEIQASFQNLNLPPRLNDVVRSQPTDESLWLQTFFATLWGLNEQETTHLLASALGQYPATNDKTSSAYWLHRCNELYPNDLGALAPIYLNIFELKPSQATYLDAGTMHAYLEGSGIELMANSDNVLRGGLTNKHVDIDELLSIGKYQSESVRILQAQKSASNAWLSFDTPVADFKLFYATSDDALTLECAELPRFGRILLVTEGAFSLTEGADTIQIKQGESVFIAAESQPTIQGSGTLFLATKP